MHKTNNLNDGYKGSGKILCDYYKKHTNDYVKEIISYYDDFESLCEAEKELIGDLYTTDQLCINIKPGGNGGSYKGINKGKIRTEESKKKQSESMKGKSSWNKGLHYKFSEEDKIKYYSNRTSPMKGKHQSDEAKNKISQKLKGVHLSEETKQKMKGRTPSNKGKHIVWNEEHTKFHYE
jgi:hypothetical protein